MGALYTKTNICFVYKQQQCAHFMSCLNLMLPVWHSYARFTIHLIVLHVKERTILIELLLNCLEHVM